MSSDHQRAAETAIDVFRRELGPFATAVEATRMPMMFTDARSPGSPIVFVNESFTALLGYSPSEILGTAFQDFLASCTNSLSLAQTLGSVGLESTNDPDVLLRKSDGTECRASVFVTPVRDGDGDVSHLFAAFIDLTTAKTHQEDLRFRAVVLDSVTEAVFATNLSGHITSWNRGAASLYGRPASEASGRDIWDLTAETTAPQKEAWQTAVSGGELWTNDVVAKRRDGTTFPARLTHAPIRDHTGELIGSVTVSSDMTERHRRDRELESKTLLLEAALENMYQGLIAIDPEDRVTVFNSKALGLLGLPLNLMLGRPTLQQIYDHQALVGEFPAAVKRERQFGDDPDFYERTRPDGTAIEVRTVVLPDGGAVRTYTDITANRRAKEDLRASEERYRALVSVTSSIFWRAAPDDTIFDACSSLTAPGLTASFVGESWSSLASAKDAARVLTERAAVLRSGEAREIGFRFRTRDAGSRWMRCCAVALFGQGGVVTEWIGTLQDIDSEKAREESLDLRDRALAAISQGVVITDPRLDDNPVIYVNPAFERITGYTAEEAIGLNCRFLQGTDTSTEAISRIRAAIGAGQSQQETVLNDRKDGTSFWNELVVSPVRSGEGAVTHFVGTLSDVTERRLLESQLRQSQKMEVVGQLTGGIAHDFNNLLTVVLGNAELITEDVANSTRTRALSGMILEAAERGAELTRHLLSFGRRQTHDLVCFRLEIAVREMSPLISRALGEHIALNTEYSDEEAWCLGDRALFESSVLNLVVNARDAMPTGGMVTVQTGTMPGGRSGTPSGSVFLRVRDSGSGMPAAIKERAFEPFFTTKDVGKGSGLGLAMVYAFATGLGGQVNIDSELGKGTTVEIVLPASERPDEVREQTRQDRPSLPVEQRRVLLVEDEPHVARVVTSNLTALGFEVTCVRLGTGAIDLLRQDAGFDLLLTDLVLPGGMSGADVATAARQLIPGLGILFTSGYSEDVLRKHGTLAQDIPLLRKPYRRDELAHAVDRALTAQSARPDKIGFSDKPVS